MAEGNMDSIIVVGCSDGIGLELVGQLLERGERVIGLSRRNSPVMHARYRHETIDVAEPDYRRRLEAILIEEGAPRALYYCAAIAERPSIEQLERDVRVFRVNLIAAVETAEILVPRMQANGGGAFVVLSSQADRIVNPEASSYTASKAALTAYFEGLGFRLRKTPVRVTTVRLGFVETKLARAGIQPFRMTRRKAARRLLRLLDGRAPLCLTYPKRLAPLVAAIAELMQLRILLG